MKIHETTEIREINPREISLVGSTIKRGSIQDPIDKKNNGGLL